MIVSFANIIRDLQTCSSVALWKAKSVGQATSYNRFYISITTHWIAIEFCTVLYIQSHSPDDEPYLLVSLTFRSGLTFTRNEMLVVLLIPYVLSKNMPVKYLNINYNVMKRVFSTKLELHI